MQLLITFYSMSSALLLETSGKERNLFRTVIPVPRKLGSSCGYATEVAAKESSDLVELLRGLNAEWEAVYQPCGDSYQLLHYNDRRL